MIIFFNPTIKFLNFKNLIPGSQFCNFFDYFCLHTIFEFHAFFFLVDYTSSSFHSLNISIFFLCFPVFSFRCITLAIFIIILLRTPWNDESNYDRLKIIQITWRYRIEWIQLIRVRWQTIVQEWLANNKIKRSYQPPMESVEKFIRDVQSLTSNIKGFQVRRTFNKLFLSFTPNMLAKFKFQAGQAIELRLWIAGF